MKLSREEKKTRMMARLEKATNELLDWEEQNPWPTLTQLEDIVLMLRKQIGEEMAGEVLSRMEGRALVPGPRMSEMQKRNALQGPTGEGCRKSSR